MRSKDNLEQFKANALKTARTAIRLKHSLKADIEINDRLPTLEAQIERAFEQGQAFELLAGQEFLDEA